MRIGRISASIENISRTESNTKVYLLHHIQYRPLKQVYIRTVVPRMYKDIGYLYWSNWLSDPTFKNADIINVLDNAD